MSDNNLEKLKKKIYQPKNQVEFNERLEGPEKFQSEDQRKKLTPQEWKKVREKKINVNSEEEIKNLPTIGDFEEIPQFKGTMEKLNNYVDSRTDEERANEPETITTTTDPKELVTEDTPPMTPEVELKPVSEPVEPPGASYTAEPQIHFDKDKQSWLINKTNNMEIVKKYGEC